jgi:hypothetical protein
VVAAAGLAACVAPPRATGPSAAVPDDGVRSALADGVRLYESREYVLAADRFRTAATRAERGGDRELATRATTAECTSWLLARRLAELDGCGARLDGLQRRIHRTTHGANALVALGAVAGGRPLPGVNVPRAIRPVVMPGREDLR